jgi:S-DNA-T family DNA segregation ATPase FtsK/SpoIIIE
VFAGSARQHLQDDPGWARLGTRARRRVLPLGRAVDVGLPTAVFPLDTSPGRHLAILGPTEVGSDLLHAAVLGLARQHEPGTAEFVLAGLVAVADDAVDAAAAAVRDAGHRCSEVELTGLRGVISRLAHPAPDDLDLGQLDLPELDLPELDLSELDLPELDLPELDPTGAPAGGESGAARAEASARVEATYVVVWGADALAAGLRGAVDPRWGSTGLQDLLTVLQDGPSRGAHVLTWWRVIRRFRDDLGPDGRDGVAGLVALNVPAPDLNELVGEDLGWHPRPNRALLVDRHLDATTPFVPFVRSERRGGAG